MKVVKARLLLNMVFCFMLTIVTFYLISVLSDGKKSPFASSGQSSGGASSKSRQPQIGEDGFELNGVWIASVGNIDFPSKQGQSAAALKKELDDIIDKVKKLGLNTIMFQVRPASDALYPSTVYPVSEYITGTQGAPLPDGLDPLSYIIERAHQNGLYLHAWLNPYRITTGSKSSPKHDVSVLSNTNPARLHPEWTVPYADGKLYYNPGLPEVRELVTGGVLEIVKNYDVDGIHFDDYFYPYPVTGAEFDDSAAYEKYGKGRTLEAFRRDSVNALIKGVYEAVKAERPSVLFGVSPFGIWANASSNGLGSDTNGFQSYTSQYVDSYTWVKNEWLDYIAPQIYWSMEYLPAEFDKLCDWWSEVVRGTSVKFVPGHAAYKAGDEAQIAVDETWAEADELLRQISYAKHKNAYAGSLFYGYRNIKNNVLGLYDSLSAYYTSKSQVTHYPARSVILAAPPGGSVIDADHIHLMGAAPPGKALRLGKQTINTDKYGFFSVFLPLLPGENTFVFTCGQSALTHRVTRTVPGEKRLLNRDSLFPQGDAVYYGKGELWFCARAPEGCKVSVELGRLSLALSHQGGGLYTGYMKGPAAKDGERSLGQAVFTAVKDGYTDIVTAGAVRVRAGDFRSAVVTAERARLFAAPRGAAHEDAGLLPKGAADGLAAEDALHARLGCGFLVKRADVTVSDKDGDPAPPPVNRVLSGSLRDAGNKTLLTLDMSLPVPFLFCAKEEYASLSLCYTAEEDTSFLAVSKNTLFSRVQRLSEGGRTEYRLYYAAREGFYGCSTRYEGGRLRAEFAHAPAHGTQKAPLYGAVIALDPGHGGNRGAIGPLWHYGPMEDDLNLDMAFRIRKRLEGMGAEVHMSRTSAGAVHTTEEITDFYRGVSPHLAVSVHFNSMERSVDGSLCKGAAAFYTTLFSRRAADTLLQSICKIAKRPVMEAQRASYAVTRAQEFPCVLLELGFLNNISEYGWYLDAANRQTVADAVAEGIRLYFEKPPKAP